MTTIPPLMRAAVTSDWNEIRVEKVPVPEIKTDEVLVRVNSCGVCGTDLKMLAGVYKGLWPPALPFIQGHEWAGTVVAFGREVTQFHIGDRVVAENHKGCGKCANCLSGRYNLCTHSQTGDPECKIYGHTAQGAFAEYAARPASLLHPLPDSVSFEEATIINQGALGLHAFQRCKVNPGDTVAVIGPGLIGLVSLQLAKAFGAGRVIVVGHGPRLRVACELGADHGIDITDNDPIDVIDELTGGNGADCSFECAGTVSAVNTAINCVKRGGRVALVGLTGNKPVDLNTDRIVLDEIDVFGVRSSPHAYPELIELIAAGKVNVRRLVSRTYPLEQISDAINDYRRREAGAIRMVINI